jgi:hypothetical protein
MRSWLTFVLFWEGRQPQKSKTAAIFRLSGTRPDELDLFFREYGTNRTVHESAHAGALRWSLQRR